MARNGIYGKTTPTAVDIALLRIYNAANKQFGNETVNQTNGVFGVDQPLTERFLTAIAEMRRYLMQTKPFEGITHTEMTILHMIELCERRGERASTTWLSARLGLTKSTVSQTLNSMEEKGWIRRGIDPDNRRQTIIDLTEAGKQKMEEVFQETRVRIGRILEIMGQESAERFVGMIENFLVSVKAEFQRKE